MFRKVNNYFTMYQLHVFNSNIHIVLYLYLKINIYIYIGLERSSEEGNGNRLPYFLPGHSHGQRSLAGYSPWACKESDTTEHTQTMPWHIYFIKMKIYTECIRQNAELDESQAGIKIAGRNINNLRYADDTTLMAESKEELKNP